MKVIIDCTSEETIAASFSEVAKPSEVTQLTVTHLTTPNEEFLAKVAARTPAVRVLSISDSSIRHVSKSALRQWTHLGALLAPSVSLLRLDNVEVATTLNTLVVSGNKLTAIPPRILRALPGLSKLSAGNNELTACPDLSGCPRLRELRLTGNTAISTVDPSFSRLLELRVLGLARTAIAGVAALAPLKSCRLLVNIDLAGTPLAAEESYVNDVRRQLPRIQILDNKKMPAPTTAAAAAPAEAAAAAPTAAKPKAKAKVTKETLEAYRDERLAIARAAEERRAAAAAEEAGVGGEGAQRRHVVAEAVARRAEKRMKKNIEIREAAKHRAEVQAELEAVAAGKIPAAGAARARPAAAATKHDDEEAAKEAAPSAFDQAAAKHAAELAAAPAPAAAPAAAAKPVVRVKTHSAPRKEETSATDVKAALLGEDEEF